MDRWHDWTIFVVIYLTELTNFFLTTWTKTLYKNHKSKVKVNGFCSNLFKVERGVRQSSILWTLYKTPVRSSLSKCTKWGNTRWRRIYTKDSLFCWWHFIFIQNHLQSIPALMQCLHRYSSVSGYKINENKSEALIISGNWPVQLNENVSFCWPRQGAYQESHTTIWS